MFCSGRISPILEISSEELFSWNSLYPTGLFKSCMLCYWQQLASEMLCTWKASCLACSCWSERELRRGERTSLHILKRTTPGESFPGLRRVGSGEWDLQKQRDVCFIHVGESSRHNPARQLMQGWTGAESCAFTCLWKASEGRLHTDRERGAPGVQPGRNLA